MEPVQGRAVDLRRYRVLINTRGHAGENARGPNARINKYRIQNAARLTYGCGRTLAKSGKFGALWVN